jgi:hypothetical protein
MCIWVIKGVHKCQSEKLRCQGATQIKFINIAGNPISSSKFHVSGKLT